MDLRQIQNDLIAVLNDYFDKVDFPENGIFVVGCSTSEIVGSWMGTESRLDVGKVVFNTISDYLKTRNINIAIQGCEHINRAILVEKKVADKNNLDVVSVVPAIHAGGGTSVAGYEAMEQPVEVEHITAFGGIDIGGTEIGMHIKFVQVPVRTEHNMVGKARVTTLKSRPKLIGGSRAQYEFTNENTREYVLHKEH